MVLRAGLLSRCVSLNGLLAPAPYVVCQGKAMGRMRTLGRLGRLNDQNAGKRPKDSGELEATNVAENPMLKKMCFTFSNQ